MSLLNNILIVFSDLIVLTDLRDLKVLIDFKQTTILIFFKKILLPPFREGRGRLIMKQKLFTLFLALIASVGTTFAARDVVPSDAVLKNYYKTGQLCVCIFVPAEMACNDVVFVGTYNRDASDAWITDVNKLAKFQPVEGYDGWYVLAVNDETPADFQGKGIRGKPVVLDQDGNFNWAYQVGDVTVIRGGVTVVAGFSGEIDLVGYTKDAPNVFIINALKANANPRTAVYHDYTFIVISDGCSGYVVPFIIGDMTDWGFQQMQVNVEKTQELGAPVYYYNFKCAEGTRYQILSGLMADDGTIAEYPTWDNPSYLEQLVDDVWSRYTEDYNGEPNVDLYTGANANITFDVRKENFRWARCAAPEDAFEVAVSLIAPAGAPAAGVDIIGSFDGWTGSVMTLANGVYTATVSATPSQVFKFRKAGTWDNEILVFDWEAGGWKGFPDTQFQSVWEPAAEKGKMVINLDLSDPTMYKWKSKSASENWGYNLTWTLSNGVLTITGTGSMSNFSNNTPPWAEYSSSIQSVVINDGVTSIGDLAFSGCKSLTSITLPNSLTSIGNSAFYNCSSLTSVTIPNSVTGIGYRAFYRTGIYNNDDNWENDVLYINDCLIDVKVKESISGAYKIKEGTRLIANSAFSGCFSLASITIPNSLTSIGNSAFFDCSSLTSVTINSNTIVNKTYNSSNNLSNIFGSQVTKYIIGDNVKRIGEYTFSGCSSLTSITIPNSVTSIGYRAFNSCFSLTSVTIPNSVTSIGDNAFSGCSKLTSPVYNAHCFAYMPTSYSGAYTIPEGIKQIAGGAFYGCSSLTSVTIPNSVTSIGDNAFSGCSKLTSVRITDIKAWCKISFGNYNANPLYYAHNLYLNGELVKDLVIPNGVTSIGRCAFYGYTELSSIAIRAEIPPTIYGSTFYDVATSIPVYVPCGCVNAYKNTEGWRDFSNIQVPLAEYLIMVDVTDTIMGSAVVMENTVCGNMISAIPNFGYHFVQWSDGNAENPRTLELTQDTILTAEFAQSFSGQCGDNLYWEFIDGNLHITGNGTMYNYSERKAPWTLLLSSIKSLSVSESATSIGEGAFTGCSSLTYVAIPNSVTSIGSYAFYDCSNITSVRWNAKNCNSYNFGSQVASFEFGNEVEVIPSSLCKGMEKLTSITIPNSAKSIGVSAFKGCIRLGKVSLGKNLETIGANAFAECTRLYDIYTYATYPPFAEESSFANYNVYVYVPCEYQRDYTLDVVWGKFKFIECISSDNVTTDEIVVTPSENEANVIWPSVSGAASYELVIKDKNGNIVCTLIFNANGQLTSIAFNAPSRNGAPAQTQSAGFSFTITGLDSGTGYDLTLTAKDNSGNIIEETIIPFQTDYPEGIEEISSSSLQGGDRGRLILRDGQVLILRNGKTYTMQGQEVK